MHYRSLVSLHWQMFRLFQKQLKVAIAVARMMDVQLHVHVYAQDVQHHAMQPIAITHALTLATQVVEVLAIVLAPAVVIPVVINDKCPYL